MTFTKHANTYCNLYCWVLYHEQLFSLPTLSNHHELSTPHYIKHNWHISHRKEVEIIHLKQHTDVVCKGNQN